MLLEEEGIGIRVGSPGRIALMQTALEALDRADQARELLSREGITTTTTSTGAVHIHPAVRIEKDSRALFARIWSQLELGWDSEIDGRLENARHRETELEEEEDWD